MAIAMENILRAQLEPYNSKDIRDTNDDISIDIEPDTQPQTQPQQQPQPVQSSTNNTMEEALSLARQLDKGQPTTVMKDEEPKDDGMGAVEYAGDMLLGLGSGALKALNELTDFAGSTARFVGDVATKGWDESEFKETNFNVFPVYEPKSTAGKLTQGFSQFVTGLVGVGKVIKGGTVLRSFTQGAVTDALFFDRNEERLGNFIEELCPELGSIPTAARQGDNMALGAIKNSLEGLGLGLMAEGVVRTFKFLKAGRKIANGDKSKATAREFEEAREELEHFNERRTAEGEAENAERGLGRETTEETRPQGERPEAKTGEATEGTTPNERPRGTDDTPSIDDKELNDLAETLVNPREPLHGITELNNHNRQLFDTPGGSHLVEKLAVKQANLMLKTQGTQHRMEVFESAMDEMREFAPDAHAHILSLLPQVKQAGHILQHAVMQFRAYRSTIIQAATPIAQKISKGLADEHDWIMFRNLMQNLMTAQQGVSNVRTISGRTLNLHGFTIDDNLVDKVFGIKFYNLRNEMDGFRSAEGRNVHMEMPSMDPDKGKAEGIFDNFDTNPNRLNSFSIPWLRRNPTPPSGQAAQQASQAAQQGAQAAQQASMEPFTAQMSNSERNLLLRLARDLVNGRDPVHLINTQLSGDKKSLVTTLGELATEVRINSLLSSPITLGVNTVTSVVKAALLKPAEYMLGGTLQAMTSGDLRTLRYGMAYMKGLITNFWDATKMGVQSFRYGDNILEHGMTAGNPELYTRHLSAQNMNEWWQNKHPGEDAPAWFQVFAHATDWMLTSSSHIMVGSDEFVKQLTYRSTIGAKLAGEGYEQGLKGKALENYVKGRMQDFISPEGKMRLGRNENDVAIASKGLSEAKDNTWQTALPEGSFAAGLSNLANKHFFFKFMAPFIKTPTNIIKDVIRHCAAPLLPSEWRIALSNDPAKYLDRGELYGRISTGIMTIATAGYMASNMDITGAFPKNRNDAARWRELGIKPYSIRVGDSWIEYRRFDPFATVLSMVVDGYNACLNADYDSHGGSEITDSPAYTAITTSLVSLVTSLRDKTYFQGIADTVSVLNNLSTENLGKDVMRFGSRAADSFLPQSGARRFIRNQFTDEYQRETSNIQEYVQNNIPFLSNDLPERRSWLTGDPMTSPNPLKSQYQSNDVLEEMARLSKVIGAPPRQVKEVELSPAQYARLCELHGTTKIGGMTLEERLLKIINAPWYDKNRRKYSDAEGNDLGFRAQALNKVIMKYRERAVQTLRREDDQLENDIAQVELRRRMSKRGKGNEGFNKKARRFNELVATY